MITALHSLGTAQSLRSERLFRVFPDMSDLGCDGPDQCRTERPGDHAVATAQSSWADRSRMIAVIPETIPGRYLPAIPADGEDWIRD
jgi:hypothetical protein